MDSLTLPPVASNFNTFCKKCDSDRYHRVLTHTSTIAAKIECEVCHSKKTYKITDPNKEKRKTAKTTKRVSKSASEAAASHKRAYENFMSEIGTESTSKYNMRSQFGVNSAIEHPKFGLGFVTHVMGDKIEVCFEDSQKMLVHNRD